MTRDDIIKMAREAECEETWGADAFRFGEVELERFAALIAAAEREACIEIVDINGGSIEIVADIRARGNT